MSNFTVDEDSGEGRPHNNAQLPGESWGSARIHCRDFAIKWFAAMMRRICRFAARPRPKNAPARGIFYQWRHLNIA